MAMTRKHFEKLATVISDHVQSCVGAYGATYRFSEEFLMLEEIASDLSDVCEGENELFDREKFLTACGVN
jgi:hypothetical protein